MSIVIWSSPPMLENMYRALRALSMYLRTKQAQKRRWEGKPQPLHSELGAFSPHSPRTCQACHPSPPLLLSSCCILISFFLQSSIPRPGAITRQELPSCSSEPRASRNNTTASAVVVRRTLSISVVVYGVCCARAGGLGQLNFLDGV